MTKSRQDSHSDDTGCNQGGTVNEKKGRWTEIEDKILTEYIQKHGVGNWHNVKKHTSLARSGKSCRLRWLTQLRPNLKKGPLSPEEERRVVELHASLGPKWAQMALQLPGRTDNEIKNFWHTRSERLRRTGQQLYPEGVYPKSTQSVVDIRKSGFSIHNTHNLRLSSSPINGYSSALNMPGQQGHYNTLPGGNNAALNELFAQYKLLRHSHGDLETGYGHLNGGNLYCSSFEPVSTGSMFELPSIQNHVTQQDGSLQGYIPLKSSHESVYTSIQPHVQGQAHAASTPFSPLLNSEGHAHCYLNPMQSLLVEGQATSASPPVVGPEGPNQRSGHGYFSSDKPFRGQNPYSQQDGSLREYTPLDRHDSVGTQMQSNAQDQAHSAGPPLPPPVASLEGFPTDELEKLSRFDWEFADSLDFSVFGDITNNLQ